MKMKFQICILVVVTVQLCSSAAPGKRSKCRPLLRAADKGSEKAFLIIDREIRSYQTVEDFDTHYCKKAEGWREDVGKYKRCLKPFPAQIWAMTVSNMKKTWKNLCASDEDKVTALNHLKCITDDTRPKFLEVGNMVVSMVEYVSKVNDLDQAIPSMCCGAKNLEARILKTLESTCSSVGMKDSGKWLTDVPISMLSDSFDMLCGSFSTVDDCSKKVPDILTKVDAATKIETPSSNATVLTNLVRLIKRLDRQLTIQ